MVDPNLTELTWEEENRACYGFEPEESLKEAMNELREEHEKMLRE